MENSTLREFILKSLAEDLGDGDHTSMACIPESATGKAKLLIKEKGVLAGIRVAKELFVTIDKTLKFEAVLEDGARVVPGDIAFFISGPQQSILKSERLVLNIMQRMSGIATMAFQFRDKVKHTKAKIIDTRKTVPGLRLIDKLAVRIGGCENHRMGLYDMFLIKDNHIAVAGSITKAVKECSDYRVLRSIDFPIEVETTNLLEVAEAIQAGADIIMLDNFEIGDMARAVKLIKGKCKVEASGGVNFYTVKNIAETGVDFISVGAVTHSVKSLDISLEVQLSWVHAK